MPRMYATRVPRYHVPTISPFPLPLVIPHTRRSVQFVRWSVLPLLRSRLIRLLLRSL